MNISEEARQKAREIKIMLSRLEPEVLYSLADFMDVEGCADDGMHSQCVYEAAERADIWSNDGKPQEFIMYMGMSLMPVIVTYNFQQVDEEDYEIANAEIKPYIPAQKRESEEP